MTADAAVARPRTAAATAAQRRRGAHTTACDLVRRLPDVSDRDLVTVTERLIVECAERGIDVTALLPSPTVEQIEVWVEVDGRWVPATAGRYEGNRLVISAGTS